MSKFILVLGNITFHHFSDEEKTLFLTHNNSKALVHELYSCKVFDTTYEAEDGGEEALQDGTEGYLVLGSFNGEVAYEQVKDKNEIDKIIKDFEIVFVEYVPLEIDRLRYYQENEGNSKTFQDINTGNWYSEKVVIRSIGLYQTTRIKEINSNSQK